MGDDEDSRRASILDISILSEVKYDLTLVWFSSRSSSQMPLVYEDYSKIRC